MAKATRLRDVDEDEDEDDDQPNAADLEKGRMPFLAHLADLRDRVRNAAIFFILAFIICWYFADSIYEWLRTPLFHVWNTEKAGQPEVVFTTLTEPFWVEMSIGLWAGIFAA